MAGDTGWSKNGIGKSRRSSSRASTPPRFFRCCSIHRAGFSENRPCRVLPTITEMTATFGVGAYATSKWGVRGLTKTAALELARDNIRVNSIHPGNVRTPMVMGSDAAEVGARAVRDLAIPRIAEPEEITRMVLFVASDEASFSTGSEFIADGGQLLGPVPQHERAAATVA